MDLPTLLITAALSLGVAAGLLWPPRARELRFRERTLLAIALGSAGFGLLLMACPDAVPCGTMAGPALLLGGAGLAWAAAGVHARQTPRIVIAGLGVVVWLLALRVPGFAASDALHLALPLGIGGAYAVGSLWVVRPTASSSGHSSLLVILGAHAALYLAGAAAIVLDSRQTGALVRVLLLDAQVAPVAVAVLLRGMAAQRVTRAQAVALAAARATADARRRFVAHLSHEIRTPLNGVLGLAQHLRRDVTLGAGQRQQVDTIEAAGRHLLAIVNDTLDLARIDAGHVELACRPFDPLTAVDSCLALVRPAAIDKRITLRLGIGHGVPAMVTGDGTRLQQILLNLLWNAVKFTPAGGDVLLRMTALDELRIEVTDTGPGIPQASWDRLFQDFSPLDPTLGGSGLGLAISGRLAARMGGRLSYRPGPHGRGAMFRLELPWRGGQCGGGRDLGRVDDRHPDDPARADAPQPAAARRRETRPAPADGLRLLVVDDVDANRFLLRAMLTAQGHRVTEAANCADALRSLQADSFDAVLLDLHMPEVDGFETARQIRRMDDATAAGTLLLAVSADDSPATLHACHCAGMAGLIPKPIEYSGLLAAMGRLQPERAGLLTSA